LEKEVDTLPSRIISELNAKDREVDITPSFLNEEILYHEQLE
jgi:hypothetical protein